MDEVTVLQARLQGPRGQLRWTVPPGARPWCQGCPAAPTRNRVPPSQTCLSYPLCPRPNDPFTAFHWASPAAARWPLAKLPLRTAASLAPGGTCTPQGCWSISTSPGTCSAPSVTGMSFLISPMCHQLPKGPMAMQSHRLSLTRCPSDAWGCTHTVFPH